MLSTFQDLATSCNTTDSAPKGMANWNINTDINEINQVEAPGKVLKTYNLPHIISLICLLPFLQGVQGGIYMKSLL